MVVSYPGICCKGLGSAIWVTDLGYGRARKEKQDRERERDEDHDGH